MAKSTREKISTPIGTFRYPRLNKPDTKYKPEGEYSVKVRLPEADAQPLVDRLNALYEQHYKDTCTRRRRRP